MLEDSRQSAASQNGQFRQLVCHGLIAVLLLRFHSALFEGEVVVEEEDEQVPEDSCLQQVHLQVAVDCQGGDALGSDGAERGKMLKKYNSKFAT